LTQFCAIVVRERVQKRRGCALGNVSPYAVVVLVEVAEKITMDAEPVLDGSAVLVAVTLTVDGDGTVEGAVYSPAPLTVPHAAELHPAPCTVHVTAVFDVPTTEAFNCSVDPVATDVLAGVTVTATTGTMVTSADAVLLGSAMLVATILTLGGEGATTGAV
jgi:hypothetical protein